MDDQGNGANKPVVPELDARTEFQEKSDSPTATARLPFPAQPAGTTGATEETTQGTEPATQDVPSRPTMNPPPSLQAPVTNEYGITAFLREQVVEGGGLWPFVSLDDPEFITAEQATTMEPLDLVLGVSINDQHKAYPTSMMWFHHVANDTVGGQPIAVTY